MTVTGYFAGTVIDGIPWADVRSGFVRDTTTPDFVGLNAYVVADSAGVNRFPVMAGTLMTAPEVSRILAEGLRIANRARAQIRLPLGFAVFSGYYGQDNYSTAQALTLWNATVATSCTLSSLS